MWEEVLSTKGEMDISQYSSSMYQKEWQYDNSIEHVFHLTEPTAWHTVDRQEKDGKGETDGRLY